MTYDFHLGAGDNGNVWAITNNKDSSRSQTFTYDPLNRLTSAQNAGTNCSSMTVNGKTEYWGNSYGYDAWGNLLQKNVTKCSAENLQVTVNASNQLQGGYTYDIAGNMLHDATANLNYFYDPENRISGAAGFTYVYDDDGNRVAKIAGDTGTLYWYMSQGIVAESDLSGNLTSEYVFFNGERVARRDFPGGEVSYYFSDHLKTTDIVTDALGNIKNESDFYPWGGELEFSANDTNHYKFTGKERDSETGLDYFGARYYSNGLGRFITPDWAAKPAAVPYAVLGDPQSLNLYTYVRNIPTSGVDADGHQCDSGTCQTIAGIGVGIGNFILDATPVGGLKRAVRSTKEAVAYYKATPAQRDAYAKAEVQNTATMFLALTGDKMAQGQLALNAMNTWKSMSTMDKASAVTQTALGIAAAVVAAKIPAASGVIADTEFSGIPTIGGRLPINSRYAGGAHPSGVEFNAEGFPNFGPHSVAEVQLQGLPAIMR